jgi:cytochrome bd-type quinol oxidase subunit 2
VNTPDAYLWLPSKGVVCGAKANIYERPMSTLETTLTNLFPLLMLIGLISPLVALISAIVFYARHRDLVEPERRVPVIAFILALVVCAVVGGCFGLYLGLNFACNSPRSGNLCGLWAFLVTGPILMAFGIFLVGLAVSAVKPRPTS